MGERREGLANYKRILDEFPGKVPASPYWTGRTCGTHNGKWLIDRELMDFTFPRVMLDAKTPEKAERLREEFLELAPQMRTIRFHTLLHLARKLRGLGAEDRAAGIDARLGLCKTWSSSATNRPPR